MKRIRFIQYRFVTCEVKISRFIQYRFVTCEVKISRFIIEYHRSK